MQIKRLSFMALFSVAMLFSCTNDEVDDNIGGNLDVEIEGAIDVEASIGEDMGYTKGTPITTGSNVTSIGIFTNVRTATTASDGKTLVETSTYLSNSQIERNLYGKLEFLDIAYWPVLNQDESLGFIAYSPYTDVDGNGNGTTTSSGLSAPTSTNMSNFSITYEVPEDVANQPDLLISEPVEQTEGTVSLVLNHALATIVFNVQGDGVQPVSSISITKLASKATLNLTYDSETTDGETTYEGKYVWSYATDNGATVTNDFELSIANETLTEVSPTDSLTTISSATGYLMMIPQTVSASTEIVITFTDGLSRSVRFFDDQVWESGGLYSYNINVDFEGEVIDFSDKETVNTLVGYDNDELETANCYILNPPIYDKEQEAEYLASKAAGESTVASYLDTPLYFTRTENLGDDDTTSSVDEVNYGALYYIPITSRMEEYYTYYAGSSVPTHDDWIPEIIWHDCEKDPIDEGVIIKRVEKANGEERFSVYIPYGYTNFGNISVAVKSDKGPIIWSWHLWLTDYNPYYDKDLGYDAKADETNTGAYTVNVEGGELHHYRDNQATPVYYWSGEKYYLGRLIMDRNLGSMNNNGGTYAENKSTTGLFYQYGRKDPFPRGASDATYYTAVDRTYTISAKQVTDLTDAIEAPLTFYDFGANNSWNNNTTYNYTATWYKIADGDYVWGDKNYTNTEAGEYYKSLFDPSPLGFMVPTINVWNDFVLGSASSNVTLTSDENGICYSSGTYGGDENGNDYLKAQYPLSNFIHGSTGNFGGETVSGCWTSTAYAYYSNVNYKHYNWSHCMYFYSGGITKVSTMTNDVYASRTMGYQVRPIQRWYGAAYVTEKP